MRRFQLHMSTYWWSLYSNYTLLPFLHEKKEQKLFNHILRQILFDSKDALMPSLHFLLLSAEKPMVVQVPQCPCKFLHARDPKF